MADDSNGTIMLILLWIIWPVGLIWYLVDENLRKTAWVKYQFKQWLAAVLVSLVAGIVSGILMVVLIGFVLLFILWILGIVWLIQGIIYAIKKEQKPLWLIGPLGDKFTF